MLRLFTAMMTRLALVRNDERGGNLVEYALLLALIVIGAIFGVSQIGEATSSNLESVVPFP